MKTFSKVISCFVLAGIIVFQSCKTGNHVIWQIGEADNRAAGFALAPNDYKNFLEKDFGWEDRFFLIGQTDAKSEFPYVLPGPSDDWGGTGQLQAGGRTR